MRTTDYREYNPDMARACAYAEGKDVYVDYIESSRPMGSADQFAHAYADDYMSDAPWSDQRLHACETALAEINRLKELRDELRASVDTVMSGPCAWNGGELTPSAAHDTAFYRARLGEVEDSLWEALDAYKAEFMD